MDRDSGTRAPSDGIRAVTRENIEFIEINRVDRRNALSIEDRFALRKALDEAESDPYIRAVVITGRGDHFCSGGDVREFTVDRDRLAAHHYALTTAQMVFRALRAMSTPTVARVRGAAAGAGMSLALGCDIVVAERDAYFHPAHLDLAVVPDWGLIWLLPRLLGLARAKAVLLARRRITAEEAMAWGLIAECVDSSQLDETVERYCNRLVDVPEVPLGLTRHGLDRSLDMPLDQFLEWEADAIAQVLPLPEHRERVEYFLTRR